MPTAERAAGLTDGVREAVLAPLDALTRVRRFAREPEPVVLVLRDDGGGVAGRPRRGGQRTIRTSS